ncbi:hypothetical protein N7G274_006599 [Stereocaulon virgatum]|uniref:Uncharacterized protein n=1 Tax=Stereocaulon virgatum TaxID=373712 RepID=A0ABR4A6B8_9LECA
MGVGLAWEEVDEIAEEVEVLVTNRMDGVASQNILFNETNMVKCLRIHNDQCIVLLGDILQLQEEILDLDLEANAAEADEKERREKYKRDWAVYSEEISSRVNGLYKRQELTRNELRRNHAVSSITSETELQNPR